MATSPFATAVSQPIEVVIADLCLETQFTIQETTLNIDLTVLGPEVTRNFDKPITVLEVQVNQPHICGSVQYELIRQSGPPGVDLTPTIDPNVPSVSAKSTKSDQIGGYYYILRSKSSFYPQLFIDRDLFINVDDCIITLFEFS